MVIPIRTKQRENDIGSSIGWKIIIKTISFSKFLKKKKKKLPFESSIFKPAHY